MEQDNVFIRNQPLTTVRGEPFALLLAGHGEQRQGAENESIVRLAATLAASNVAAEVGYGFIKGTPTIDHAILASKLQHILIYPLFMSDGYFTRVLLPQLVEEAASRKGQSSVQFLPPFGLDPQLADLVIRYAASVAEARNLGLEQTTIILCAHGSRSDAASRSAAKRLADDVAKRQRFADVSIALLEESPEVEAVIAENPGPIVVVGLFVGEGLHGGHDIPELVARSGRGDVIFAGNVGTFPGVQDVVAAAVRRAALRTPLPNVAID